MLLLVFRLGDVDLCGLRNAGVTFWFVVGLCLRWFCGFVCQFCCSCCVLCFMVLDVLIAFVFVSVCCVAAWFCVLILLLFGLECCY